MQNYMLATAVAGLTLLTACPNPADKAPKAKTGPAAAKSKPKAATSKPAAAGAVKTFKIDPAQSKIGFVGSKVTGKHEGGFKKFSGAITVNLGNLSASTVEVEIDMTSTWSDSDKLTGHLKAPDFFDVAKFPKSKFVLTKAEAKGSDLTLTGTLDFHGVKKAISFPAKITATPTKVTATSEFSLNRKDFDVNYPGKTDDLIRDDVLIKLNLVAM